MFGFNAASRTGVMKIIFREIGTYNQQFSRPYQSSITGQTIQTVQSRISPDGSVTPAMFSGICGEILAPQMAPEARIGVVNGFENSRFAVTIIAETKSPMANGGSVIDILSGYTDYMGINKGTQQIDPNMQIIINSAIRVQNVVEHVPGVGSYTRQNVMDATHLIANPYFESVGRNDLFTMTPADTFSAMTQNTIAGNLGATMINGSTLATDEAKTVRAVDSIPTNYMTQLMDAFNVSSSLLSLDYQDSGIPMIGGNSVGASKIFTEARASCVTREARSIELLSIINQSVSGYSGVTDRFNYGSLLRCFPYLDTVTDVFFQKPTTRIGNHQAGMTAEWSGSKRMELVATQLSNTIPAMLMASGIQCATVNGTNRSIGAVPSVSVSNVLSFNNYDMSTQLRALEQKIIRDVVPDISLNGLTDFMFSMSVNLSTETWISLSIDGDPMTVEFVTPSFCDNLLSPMITLDQNRLTSLARGMENLLTHTTPDSIGIFSGAASPAGIMTPVNSAPMAAPNYRGNI